MNIYLIIDKSNLPTYRHGTFYSFSYSLYFIVCASQNWISIQLFYPTGVKYIELLTLASRKTYNYNTLKNANCTDYIICIYSFYSQWDEDFIKQLSSWIWFICGQKKSAFRQYGTSQVGQMYFLSKLMGTSQVGQLYFYQSWWEPRKYVNCTFIKVDVMGKSSEWKWLWPLIMFMVYNIIKT